MKNFIIGFCSIVILILAGLTFGTVHGKTLRENELSSTVSASMEQSMRMLTLDRKYHMENEKEFVSDFIEASLVKMDSKSDYEIKIHEVDAEKGILDVTVTEHYTQVFVPGKVSCRKSVILDDYSDRREILTVTFKAENKVVKQMTVMEGDFMTPEMLPDNVHVLEWKLEQNGNIYKDSNIANVAVMQNLTFVDVAQNRITVTFHRGARSTDAATAEQTFVAGVPGQKFSAKGWTRKGYTLAGWSLSKNATTAQYGVLSSVSDSWIKANSPKVDLYAVWKPTT